MNKREEINAILSELKQIEAEKKIRLDEKRKPAVEKFIKDYSSKLTSFDGVYLKRVNERQFDHCPNTYEYIFIKHIHQGKNWDIEPIIDDNKRINYTTREFNKNIKEAKMIRTCEAVLIYRDVVKFTQDEHLSVRALIDDYQPITKEEFMDVFNTLINKNH